MTRYVAPEVVKQQIERLVSLHPELADDDDFRRDVIEGQTDFDTLIERLIREAKTLEVEVEAVKEYALDLVARSGRKAQRIKTIRETLSGLLDAAGLPNVKTPSGTVSLGSSARSVVITDEAVLPADFLRTRIEPNKTAIKEALEAGQTIPGAALSNGGRTLRIM